jgi:hypothetical protein
MFQDFEDLLSALNDEGAKYLVVGGYALAIHGTTRATKDLDIFIGTDRENGRVVWRALAKFGAPVANVPPDDMAEPYTFFTWGMPPYRVDILTNISAVKFADAWKNSVRVTVNDKTGLQARFISAEDFIANKLQASVDDPNRLYDRADAEDVRRTQERRRKQEAEHAQTASPNAVADERLAETFSMEPPTETGAADEQKQQQTLKRKL